MDSNQNATRRGLASPILAGLLYAYAGMILAALIISGLLALTGLQEQTLNVYAFFIHGLAICIGGFVTGRRVGSRGWYCGGLVGLIYCLIIILAAFLGFDASIGLPLLALLGLSCVSGMLGGIIGVNARSYP